jgi:signal peptidase II
MIWCFVFSLLLVAADQFVKYLTVTHLALQGQAPFLPGLLDLTYVQNTGAAWSIMREHTWLLAVISALSCVVILIALLRPYVTHPLGRWSLCVILGGSVGNLIDRVRLGYVVDMFETTFIHFPVFNIADMSIVIGGILFCIYVILFYDKYESGRKRRYGDHYSGSRRRRRTH